MKGIPSDDWTKTAAPTRAVAIDRNDTMTRYAGPRGPSGRGRTSRTSKSIPSSLFKNNVMF